MNGLIEIVVAAFIGSFFSGARSMFGKWMITTLIIKPLKKLLISGEQDWKLYLQMRHEAMEKRKSKIK